VAVIEMFRMKQKGMVAILGLALVLATATVSLVPVQQVSALGVNGGHQHILSPPWAVRSCLHVRPFL